MSRPPTKSLVLACELVARRVDRLAELPTQQMRREYANTWIKPLLSAMESGSAMRLREHGVWK